MNVSTSFARLFLCGLLLCAGATGLSAQTIYRIVGPDGKVTFSDKPPVEASKVTSTTAGGKALANAADSGIPYELRQVMARYPVTLYSGAGCAPCNSGRLLLQGRGIPFTEFTISTPEDGEALQRLSGDNSLPFLTIGGQKIKGYSEAEWTQFLNAANYPASSVLAATYRNAPAKALVTVQKPAPAKAEDDASARVDDKSADNRAQPAPPPPPSTANPGGIRF